MRLILSRILSRSNCILILVVSNLACSAPLKSRKRGANEHDQGFSSSPKILEIQLPLKIASKEDLLAWSKYVMTLVAPKTNFTSSSLKNAPMTGPQYDRRVSLPNLSIMKSKEIMKKASTNEKHQGINYPARRLKEPPVMRPDDKVTAYPLPVGKMKFTAAKLQEPFSVPSGTSAPYINEPVTDQQLYLEQFTNFNFGSPFHQGPIHQSEPVIFGPPEMLVQAPPAATYLPLPPFGPATIIPYQNIIERNVSQFEEPAKLSTKKSSLNLRVKALNNELAEAAPPNRSQVNEPFLTLPFQAVITITRQPADATASKTQQKAFLATRAKNPLDQMPANLKNYTLTNESGQVNVIFEDFAPDTNKKKIRKNEREEDYEEEERQEEEEKEEEEEEEEENEQDLRDQKKNEKNKTPAKQQKSRKRAQFILGDLLRMLGILRKLPSNTTEISVGSPVLSILKGTNQPKIQVAFEDELTPPNRERNNETFAQQTDDDDNSEEEGGSVQAILDLLPLAAPILEDLSDPESNVDIAELLRGAIPLLEGLSDPNEEGGIDIPGVLVPLSQRLSEGPNGTGSDSGAILGPLIQIIAPLIGPLVGPLIGPLSQTSSGAGGKENSGALLTQLSGPLSEKGANGQSILSWLIASITAKLSTELSKSAGDSDVQALVSAVVSGVLAGASAGSKGAKGGGGHGYGAGYGAGGNSYGNNNAYGTPQRDTFDAPTTYGQPYGYHYVVEKPKPNLKDILSNSLKEIFGAFLKLSTSSATSSANLSGTSSSSSTGLSASSSESKGEQKPTYGPPVYGAPTKPPYYAPPARPSYVSPGSTSSPYVTFTRRQTQNKSSNQIKKL